MSFTADRFYGGTGNDIFEVDSMVDLTVELAGEGTDTVLYVGNGSYTLRANIENLTIMGAGAVGKGNDLANVVTGRGWANKLYGLAGDDRLYAGDGNDRLEGGLGYDRMYGGLGDDRYVVGDSTDFAYELAGEGYDRVESSIDHVLRANIEMLTLTGSANLVGKGNLLDNVIIGNDGANRLYGLDGDDRIYGDGGNDRLDGGAGADRMYGGSGDDIYYANDASDLAVEFAGGGTDTVYASTGYALRADVERLVLTGSADLNGRGNDGDNSLTANSGANKLYGYEGADVLDGRDGADLLNGGGGNDKLIGGNGDDRLYGEDGTDVLLGGSGGDRIEGGAGRDRLFGGAGADEFVFRDGDFGGLGTSASDQINDFSQADNDTIRVELVDADTTLDGNQSFGFIGSDAFHGTAGELRFEQIGANTYVQGDADGDGVADFWIRVDGVHALTSSDFIL
jgi:Ca2+-binding RTX toxin-like protein